MKTGSVDHAYVSQAISAAFETEELQRAVSTAIEWAPEIKHETLVATMLSSVLNKNKTNSMREVRSDRLRRSRRYDIKIDQVPLEAKYHFEFDIESIHCSVTQAASELSHLGSKSQSSWSAGDAFLKELNRTRNSFFLWSICDRGPNPAMTACMRKNLVAWHRSLGRRGITDSAAYLHEKLNEVVNMSSTALPGLVVCRLQNVLGGNACLSTFLFFCPGPHEPLGVGSIPRAF